jgi:hypothetical protein
MSPADAVDVMHRAIAQSEGASRCISNLRNENEVVRDFANILDEDAAETFVSNADRECGINIKTMP